MGKLLLNGTEFSRIVVDRARRERPQIPVKVMGRLLLLVEPVPGHRRLVSLLDLYQTYCQYPLNRDEVIGTFLAARVYEEPSEVLGSFEENRCLVLPRVVATDLLETCRQHDRELTSVEYPGGLAIVFVVEDSGGSTYLPVAMTEQWGIGETELLTAAIENLRERTREHAREQGAYYQLGTGPRAMLVWETYDGFDASRILLTPVLTDMAARVVGEPLVAIPNRDYLVMFGDADPDFVTEMKQRVTEMYEAHIAKITPQLFTLVSGGLMPFESARRRTRVVN